MTFHFRTGRGDRVIRMGRPGRSRLRRCVRQRGASGFWPVRSEARLAGFSQQARGAPVMGSVAGLTGWGWRRTAQAMVPTRAVAVMMMNSRFICGFRAKLYTVRALASKPVRV